MSKEEKIILNVGGVKYETYKSTLTAYPDTLLGTMFQERNSSMTHPTNSNEYFFDRNSRAFHYIMEFYRTGKFLWKDIEGNPMDVMITRDEIQEEFDFFQIDILKSQRDEFLKSSQRDEDNAYENLARQLDHLLEKIIEFIIWNIERGYSDLLKFIFYSDKLPYVFPGEFDFKSFEQIGFRLVDIYTFEIQKFLTFRFPNIRIAIYKRRLGPSENWTIEIMQYFKTKETIQRSVLLSTIHE
ncbi:11300_t:CDS:2 [Ambispora leptoticha]|uniref:11300_t:CDS:1 n=1 Tax=Ambispora leptoticha TaxID=144679 RepID=A0A9N9HR56_9GLOM|nr:11300_t:CDS:2 [Ambispora leptoticha]